jgi:hypothetical protein
VPDIVKFGTSRATTSAWPLAPGRGAVPTLFLAPTAAVESQFRWPIRQVSRGDYPGKVDSRHGTGRAVAADWLLGL